MKNLKFTMPRNRAAAGLMLTAPALLAAQERPNILMIVVDDLSSRLGCMGDEEIMTPAIDTLAAEGTLFSRAYAQVPVCGPSRLSVLTGRDVHSYQWHSRDLQIKPSESDGLSRSSLPAKLKASGYYAVSNGKVFHHLDDRAEDWSEAPWRCEPGVYGGDQDWAGYNHYGIWQNKDSEKFINPTTGRGPYFESADVADEAYQDGQVATKTIEDLKRLAGSNKPFFLAAGFWRPHLPFNAPKKYFDLYPEGAVSIAKNLHAPKGLPATCTGSREIDQYALTGARKSDELFHIEARRAYYAAVSYVDAQIGRVLEAVKELGLDENTVIVLWGDHGFHLGEHQFWGKHNTLHQSVHAPLIFRMPTGSRFKSSTDTEHRQRVRSVDSPVKLTDIYPTLCEIAGLESHSSAARSLMPILMGEREAVRDHLVIRWENSRALITRRWSYTAWGAGMKHPMLFDLQNDPLELENAADNREHRGLIKQFNKQLRAYRRENR